MHRDSLSAVQKKRCPVYRSIMIQLFHFKQCNLVKDDWLSPLNTCPDSSVTFSSNSTSTDIVHCYKQIWKDTRHSPRNGTTKTKIRANTLNCVMHIGQRSMLRNGCCNTVCQSCDQWNIHPCCLSSVNQLASWLHSLLIWLHSLHLAASWSFYCSSNTMNNLILKLNDMLSINCLISRLQT